MNPLILIVDDDRSNRKLVSMVLDMEGYFVLTAETAEEALDLIRDATPDLVLIDLELPGMNGLSLAHLLRTGESTRHLPLIALSAHAMPDEISKAAAAGCDAYITKPIDTRKFCEQIARHLKADASPRPGTE